MGPIRLRTLPELEEKPYVDFPLPPSYIEIGNFDMRGTGIQLAAVSRSIASVILQATCSGEKGDYFAAENTRTGAERWVNGLETVLWALHAAGCCSERCFAGEHWAQLSCPTWCQAGYLMGPGMVRGPLKELNSLIIPWLSSNKVIQLQMQYKRPSLSPGSFEGSELYSKHINPQKSH